MLAWSFCDHIKVLLMTTVLYDRCIPFIDESFKQYAHCLPYEAGSLTPAHVCEADVLLVRSVTPVNRDLLQGSHVSYVGSVTAGVDHLDTAALDALGIAWCHAPGANAMAVAQYVASTLAYLTTHAFHQGSRRLGLVGCGEVGSRVSVLARQLAWEVCVYDPPKAERESHFMSATWDDLLSCPVLCCCVPWIEDGAWPTVGMIDADVLSRLPKDAVIINVGRGGVLDEEALLAQQNIRWCCDVWQGEPLISSEMIDRALIATPHIAGYTQEAKCNLTWQVFESIGCSMGWFSELEKPTRPRGCTANSLGIQSIDEGSLLKHYNPKTDDTVMRQAVLSQHPVEQAFRQLRSNYVYRHEWRVR